MTIPTAYVGLSTDGTTDAETAIAPDYTVNAAMLRTLARNANYMVGYSAKRVVNLSWPDEAKVWEHPMPPAGLTSATIISDGKRQPPIFYGMRGAGLNPANGDAAPSMRIPFPTSANAKTLTVSIRGSITDDSASQEARIYLGTKEDRGRFRGTGSCPYYVTINNTTTAWFDATREIPVDYNNPTEYLDLYVDAIAEGAGATIPSAGNEEAVNFTDGSASIEIIGRDKVKFIDNDGSLKTALAADDLDGRTLVFLDAVSGNVVAIAGKIYFHEPWAIAGDPIEIWFYRGDR